MIVGPVTFNNRRHRYRRGDRAQPRRARCHAAEARAGGHPAKRGRVEHERGPGRARLRAGAHRLIAATGSAEVVYLLNLVALVAAGGLALAIRHRVAPEVHPLGALRELFGGVTRTWRTKVVLGMMSIDLFAVLLGSATALLPIYAKDIL